jgi:ABC-type nitrate/sulfonate/bicarbonate transport system substrate-binding protein
MAARDPARLRRLQAVTVNVFPGGFNWGLYVGQDKGFFADNGITVELQGTPDSVTQMTDFAAARFDIAMTAIDNIVAYVEGQGQAPIGPQPEFFAFMGSDDSFLSLVAAPEVDGVNALRGKVVSVDALTTGYAFVLYEILRQNGLERDRDYTVVSAGGMAQRWAALREGRHGATLLSAPYNVLARQQGFRELVKATAAIGAYQGNVGAARRTWAEENREALAAFIAGYRHSIRWLHEAGHRQEAISVLRRHLAHMPQELGVASYDEMVGPEKGFSPSGSVDQHALRSVLDLRERCALPPKRLGPPERYIDLQYYQRA